MKKYRLIVLFMGITATLFGQSTWTGTRDSLLHALSRSKEDTNKVWTMVRLGNLYLSNQNDSVVYYAKAFGVLSEKLNFATGKAYSLSMQALTSSGEGRIDEAIAMDMEAIEILRNTNRKKALANVYNNTAIVYATRDDEAHCVDFYLKAKGLYEQLNDSLNLAMVYGNLGAPYIALREFKNAYAYTLKGILMMRSLHENHGLGTSMLNLGSALVNLQRFDTALVVLNQAQTVLMTEHGKGPDPGILALIGLAYVGLGKYDQVKARAEELMAIAKKDSNDGAMCHALSGFVDYYLHEKSYREARHYALQYLEIAKKNQAPMELRDAYNQASVVEAGFGDIEQFNYYAGLRDSIDEVIRSDEILRNTQELEAKYSLNTKQAEIDALNKEEKIQELTLRQRNTMNWVLASVVLVAGLIRFLYSRNYRQRKKLLIANTLIQQQRITELEKEGQLSAAQAVLQGQVEERTRLAKDLHDGLGSILSSAKYSFNHMKSNLIISPENAAAFEKSMDMLDRSINELRRVAHNMMPETLMKFGLDTALKDFCDGVDPTGAIKLTYQSFGLEESTIPEVTSTAVYRIVQELLNNILKHAGATVALVQLIRKNDALSVTVEDNGKGFDKKILDGSEGIGYISLRNRVTYLKGTVDIQTAPGKGTSINIEIPNIAS